MRRPKLPIRSLALLAVGVIAQLARGADAPPEKAADKPAESAAPTMPPTHASFTPGKVLVIDISGEIDLGLAPYVERVLHDAGPDDLIVLQINTFGGRIDAAVQIRDALLGAKVKTAAFIDSRAISAGALIALATDTIAMTHGATIGAATPVQIEGGKMAPVEAKVVSYFRKEMKATAEAKGRRGDIAEAMVDASVEIPGLDGKDTTLTLTTTEALKYKVAAFEVGSLDELCAKLGRPSPSVIKPGINWAERLARFLSDSTISSLLMSLGMLGIMVELWAPGHAVAGVLGVMCLVLFFFGHYVIHLAGLEEILLFVAGVGLLVFELAFWPGHGMVAVVGVLCIFASLVMALVGMKHVPFEISWQLGWVTRALTTVFGSLLLTMAGMFLVSRVLPSTRLGRPLILNEAITAKAGNIDSLVGRHGVTETALRPAGKATVGGKRLDVVTDGGFLEAGERVVVAEVDGPRIVVRRA